MLDTPPEMLASLDPGIREVVRWLRLHDFETTDSGDGAAKPAAGDEDAMTEPHVFVRVPPRRLVVEADRLDRLLSTFGLDSVSGRVQATYDPADEVGVIVLLGVNDASLKTPAPPVLASPG